MKLIGIRRDPRYSPRSVERDAAILEAVALRLTEVGAFQVDLVSESEFGEECLPQVDGVFTMARSPRVLSVLAAAESRGVPVWNSARGVQGLSRRGVNDMGRKLGVSVPPSVAVSGNGRGDGGTCGGGRGCPARAPVPLLHQMAVHRLR